MKTRKILSVLLCAIMVMAIIPVSVFMASAADDANVTIRGYQQTKVQDGVWSIRFVATGKQVDGIERVGFEVTLTGGKTEDQSTSIVYESLNANYGAETVTAESYGDDYITAIAVNGIPYDSGEIEFTVKPYIQVSGEKQYGEESTAKVYPNYDESFLTQRDAMSTYISNFNNESVMEGANAYGISPWGDWTSNSIATVTHGSLTNAYGTVTGVNLAVDGSNYAGFQYVFPKTVDLTKAEKLVFKYSATSWTSGYSNMFLYLQNSGNYNALKYCQFYSGPDMSGTPVDLANCSTLPNTCNFLSGYLVLDVAKFIEDTGISSIKGFIIGFNNKNFTITYDEVYYTNAKGEDGFKFDLAASGITSKGSYTVADTADGMLQVSGAGWGTGATYALPTAIDNSDITTITVRFKYSGNGVPILYLNTDGSTGGAYINLGNTDYGTKTTDDEGFTVYEMELAKITVKYSSFTSVSSFIIKNNNASVVATYDYIIVK